MTDHRVFPACLRALAGFAALAAVLALSACGGGSGAPNNPYAPGPGTPGPLTLLPDTATVYSGIPTTLTADGGQPPYLAFSSDSSVLPVTQAVPGNSILLLPSNVGADTAATITVQDSTGKTASSTITVKAAPLLPNGITVTANGDCAIGATTLCSGGTGIATVIVTAPGGGGIPGRQVRFDVIAGAYQLQTANPAVPLAATLNVITDANGQASVGIAVNVNAPTQIASIRATEVTSGNQITGQFLIQQVTDGSQVLSMIPSGDTTITGPDANTCSTGVAVVYHIYGGTPPYQVSAPFAGAVSLSGVPVTTNGGSFTATTAGACFDKMPFAVTDATGRTIPSGSSPTLTNAKGSTGGGGGTPTAVTATPATITVAGCTGKTINVLVSGGTPPYSVTFPGVPPTPLPIVTPNPVPASGITVAVSGLLTGSGPTTILFVDSSSPKQNGSFVVTCP
jgi:hypothetical protein